MMPNGDALSQMAPARTVSSRTTNPEDSHEGAEARLLDHHGPGRARVRERRYLRPREGAAGGGDDVPPRVPGVRRGHPRRVEVARHGDAAGAWPPAAQGVGLRR